MESPQKPEPISEQLAALWMTCMRCGDWEAAWQIADRILQGREETSQPALPRHLQAVWNGKSLAGKQVLVRCYHGMGDTVQFIRFVPLLRQIASRVIVWAQPQLIPLLATMRDIDLLLPLHDGIPAAEYDCDIEIMELPHALRITLETLPATVPYLDVQAKVLRDDSDPRLRVGIVWQSGTWDPQRSVAPELLERLLGIEGVVWKVMQRGPALAAWTQRCAETPDIADILAEASQLRALDLLISVDTLSAHLGGALGVRTWTMLPVRADWRWMDDREDTPWYPTMRLFRRQPHGGWASVIARVGSELRQLCGTHAATVSAKRDGLPTLGMGTA